MGACKGNDEPVPINPSSAHAYYVAPNGSNNNPGTAEAPFKNIMTALGKAIPGDTVIVRRGIYEEKISFPRSGRLDNYIVLQSYPGETAVIDGTTLSVSRKEALVTMRNVRYIIFERFELRNFKSTTPWVSVNGILVDEGSGDIIIRKNKIYNIEHNVKPDDGRSAHGIEIIGNTNVAIKNILVEENEIHDCNTGYSENLTINGYVDGFTLRKNKVYNAENIGIVAAGGYSANANPAFNYVRNGLITENEIFNVMGSSGPIPVYQGEYGAAAIYIDGARNIIIERNLVHDNDRGIGIVSENDAFPTQECIVRNNFVCNNYAVGIMMGGYQGWSGGGTNSCHVINNSLFFNNRELGYDDIVEGEIRLTVNCNDNIIKNNILYTRPERGVFINKQNTGGANNQIDYNIYFTTGSITKWVWDAVAYTDYDAWKSAAAQDDSSTIGIDPQLVNTSAFDLHIQSTSPAKDTGVILSDDIQGNLDIDGKNRIVDGKISRGAHQAP
jgi:hypothetical protein